MARYIDADALIEFIETRYDITWKDDYEGGIKDACVDILEKIKNMPTADVTKLKWIPYKDKRPTEKEEKYLVQTDSGYVCECRWTNVNHIWTELTTYWHWHIFDIPQYSKVVAWMALPKPYIEEVEE